MKITVSLKLIINCAICLLLVVACKKEQHELPRPPVVNNDTTVMDSSNLCLNFDTITAPCVVGPFFNDLSPKFEFPCFNPNDGNEFIYYSDGSIYKHNLETGVNNLVMADVSVITDIGWGETGNVTYNTLSWKVWKVKDDGSTPSQLTHTPRDLYPAFIESGDRIIYMRSMEYSSQELNDNPELRYRDKMMIVGLDGVHLDSICIDNGEQCQNWGMSSWHPVEGIAHVDGEVVNGSVTKYGISSYKFGSNENSQLYFDDTSFDEFNDIEWHPDGTRIYFTGTKQDQGNWGAIYAVNVQTGVVSLIKEGCHNKFYKHISISPDGETLIAQKGTAVVENYGCDINTTWRIVKMDMDGRNEYVIDLE